MNEFGRKLDGGRYERFLDGVVVTFNSSNYSKHFNIGERYEQWNSSSTYYRGSIGNPSCDVGSSIVPGVWPNYQHVMYSFEAQDTEAINLELNRLKITYRSIVSIVWIGTNLDGYYRVFYGLKEY